MLKYQSIFAIIQLYHTIQEMQVRTIFIYTIQNDSKEIKIENKQL